MEDNILYNAEKTTILAVFATGAVEIPEGVTEIGAYTFRYSEVTSIVLPESLTKIGDYAFEYSALESVHIPQNVESIGLPEFRKLFQAYQRDFCAWL